MKSKYRFFFISSSNELTKGWDLLTNKYFFYAIY